MVNLSLELVGLDLMLWPLVAGGVGEFVAVGGCEVVEDGWTAGTWLIKSVTGLQ